MIEGIIPKKDLQQLEDLVLYFITQREMARPVEKLKQNVKDIRTMILNIILRHYVPLKKDDEALFLREIRNFLADLRAELLGEGFDNEYCNYCLKKILSAFKTAQRVKQKMKFFLHKRELFRDISILEPFDLNLRPFIRLVDKENSALQDQSS